MKITKLINRLLLFTSVFALLFSVVISPAASALDWPVGTSYFQGAGVGVGNLIPGNHLGSNSLFGSVMPNWHGTQITRGTGGAGAVGTRALGIHSDSNPQGTNADNRARKQALYDFLRNKYNGGSTTDWERMGSAFIAHQMLGKAWGAGSRSVTNPEWTEVYNRLVENDALTMNREDHSWRQNTAGVFVGSAYDAVRWEYDTDFGVDSWVFRVDGVKVYALEIICANPLGALGGLPPYEDKEYNLTPSASVNKTVVEPDDSIQVTNTVANSGPDASEPTTWRLTKMVYGPGTALSNSDKAARDRPDDPCGSFTAGGRSACNTEQELTGVVFNRGAPRTFDPVFRYDIPVDMPVGTKVCFTVSVSRPTQEDAPVWRHSTLQCVAVGKKPKLQVWGGDLRSGGEIDTSISTISSLNETYGSWGEYGVLSRGGNSGFGSGAGLNNGSSSPAQSSWSNLTFANPNDSPCYFGCYNFTLFSSPLASQFTLPSSPTTITGTQDLNSLTSGTYRGTAGTLRLSATTIDPGKTIVIISTGNVRIDGDITYNDGPYSNIRDIPQVIIKAPIIRINPAAGRVDAWLIATGPGESGELNTCWDVGIGNTADLNANICNNPLTINGPVVADSLYLRRTGGSGSLPDQRGEPAEIFNLRADAYLWANAHSSGSSRVQTVYSKELSPRF